MTILKLKEVTTRKVHRCVWCGEAIKAKGKATHRSIIWEGELHSDYFHPECYDALGNSGEDSDEGFETYSQYRGMTFEEGLEYEQQQVGDAKVSASAYSILDWRNQLKRDFAEGFSHIWLDEYRKNRNNPCWRSTKALEQLCEYILYLEEKLEKTNKEECES